MGDTYEVLRGCNYPGQDGEEVRLEPGDISSDIPAAVVKALLAKDAIKRKPKAKTKAEKGGDA